MEQWQVEALRDLAIEFLPKAQEAREHAQRFGSSEERYYASLSVNALFIEIKTTSTAVERLAARLLGLCMLPLTGYGYEGAEILKRLALDLCSATGRTLPWLTMPIQAPLPQDLAAPTASTSTLDTTETFLARPVLSTNEAARLLNLQPQTLHTWSSKQSGPIQPVRSGRRLYWDRDEILALVKKAQP